MRYFAELMGTSLDDAGISVIDFQNNGSPGAFVGLAKSFDIPWVMFCDNDGAGINFIKEIRKKGVTEAELTDLTHKYPDEGTDLELFLVKSGFISQYLEILQEQNIILNKQEGEEGYEKEIVQHLQKKKTGSVYRLIEKLRSSGADESHVPEYFKKIIRDIILKTV